MTKLQDFKDTIRRVFDFLSKKRTMISVEIVILCFTFLKIHHAKGKVKYGTAAFLRIGKGDFVMPRIHNV